MVRLRESTYQKKVIDKILEQFPGAVVLKSDPNYIQGIPDLLVLRGPAWAALECKRSISSPVRPNQPYYVKLLNNMSYASFIYPENEERIMNELQQTL
jgi:hypothetical protein